MVMDCVTTAAEQEDTNLIQNGRATIVEPVKGMEDVRGVTEEDTIRCRGIPWKSGKHVWI